MVDEVEGLHVLKMDKLLRNLQNRGYRIGLALKYRNAL